MHSRDSLDWWQFVCTVLFGVFTAVGVIGGLVFNGLTLREMQLARSQDQTNFTEQLREDEAGERRRLAFENRPLVDFSHEWQSFSVSKGKNGSWWLVEPEDESQSTAPSLKNFGRGVALEVTVFWQPERHTNPEKHGLDADKEYEANDCVTRPSRLAAGDSAKIHGLPSCMLEGLPKPDGWVTGSGRVEYLDEDGAKHVREFKFTLSADDGELEMVLRTQPNERRLVDLNPGFL